VDTAPFDLPGRGLAAALCLHGLTGTPYEVRPLGEALARAGVRAVGPVLPGHGRTPRELAGVSWEEWLAAARSEAEALRRTHEVVFVVGLSMGGLLTLALAAEQRADAAVVVGTPLRLRRSVTLLVPFLKYLLPFPRKSVGSDIREPEARRRHPGYPIMPLAAVHQLLGLQRHVRADLARVKAPLMVAHGALDTTAHPSNAREILSGVASRDRHHLLLERSAHVVPVDYDGPQLAAAVVEFLEGRG
jgi:carboxylesterase